MMAGMPSPPGVSIPPARACAYEVLRRVYEQGAYADDALQAGTRGLDPPDPAFALGRLAGWPPQRLDAPVLAALRLGLYELLYLRGAPDYAVVGDAVELAKTAGRAGHGLVNAVLRRAAREGAQALLGELSDATPEQAAIRHSHPQWIARPRWRPLGAEELRPLIAAGNARGEGALRANMLRTDAATLACERPVSSRFDPELPEALVLEEPYDIHGSSLWTEGAFVAQ